MTVVAFDLDGTLSDPAQGITASLNFALKQLGFPERNPDRLKHYIGPPLTDIFIDLLSTQEPTIIQQAIGHYRDRYNTIGFRENLLYDGIRDVLTRLQADNTTLYVATGKGPEIARAVIEYFELQDYFKGILGCGLQRKKHQLLEEIQKVEGDRQLIMVGDRSSDILAGKAVKAHTVGVLWGYGSVDELNQAEAGVLAHSQAELLTCLNTIKG